MHPLIILFFVSMDCPLSNRYVPEMNRIHAAYAARRVQTYAVIADPSVTTSAAAAYASEYRYTFPVLADPRQTLARLAAATVTPQAAVLSSEGEVLYLGRIDNRMEDFGKERTRVTTTDLRDALEAILAGKPVPGPVAKSIGCAIPQTSEVHK
jgi:hypothetical protein